jgi:hypothetical protein
MMKLLNQFEQVDKATPFARSDDGKISDCVLVSIGPWREWCGQSLQA